MMKIRLRIDAFDRETIARGWTTDDQRARSLGVSPTVISKLRARKTEPNAHTIDRIVCGLGVPYTALFVREEVTA